MEDFIGYERTRHIQGSRLQEGDEDLSQVPYKSLRGRWIVVEEKFDGSNSAVSFSDAMIKTQSRGHYLEQVVKPHFKLFKQWANCHEDAFFDRFYDRYVVFGEWMLGKHSVYYDYLPHYFLEFDIWDRSIEGWLDTPSRRAVIGDAPVLPVAILYEGPAPDRLEDLVEMIKPSLAKTPAWRDVLMNEATRSYQGRKDFSWEQVLKETEKSDLAEGIYIKVEENGRTVDRMKFVRHDFVQAIKESKTHWDKRPVIANQMTPGVDIFSPKLTHGWPDVSPCLVQSKESYSR